MPIKIFQKMIQHKFITGITLILIIIGGYLGYQYLVGNDNSVRYIAAAVEKGTLIVSVSGSGQVSVSDQVDIKPSASGNLSALYIKKDQEVKTGQILAVLDSGDSQRAVEEADIALENAKIELDELLSPPDAQALLQAENALAQAERDLEKAKKKYENIDSDAEEILSNAYEDGYSDVSNAFFKLSDYMSDLKDVLGTKESEDKHIGSYRTILGDTSLFVEKLLSDYYRAKNLYSKNFEFFGEVYCNDNRDTIYKLINDTLETSRELSRTLESARHMYDAIVIKDYTRYSISSTVDKMQPKIESDLSSISSTINFLQNTIDIIDETVSNVPDDIKDAELSFKLAQEKLEEKKLALEELKEGADELDIRSQKNIVAQKELALKDAKEKLADCFIRAPFDGLIAEMGDGVKRGMAVSANTVLATIITNQKIAEISLNEIDIADIKLGQKANIVFDSINDLNITGEVVEIDTLGTVTQGIVSYNVKIALDTEEERIKPKMSVTADIITNVKQDILILPNSAIKSQGNSQYVELVDESGTNREQLLADVSGTILSKAPIYQVVETGISNDLSTEVVSGLKEGDIVITSTINPNENVSQDQSNRGFQIPAINSQGRTPTRSFR